MKERDQRKKNTAKMSKYWRLISGFVLLLCGISNFTSNAQEEGGTTGSTYDPVRITAQPDIILTQHWEMPTLLNPAATGNIDFIRIRGAARLDYLGSKDSPKNFIGIADSPFKLSGKRIGAGLIVSSQSYDLFRNLLVGAQGSYKFQLKKSTLSIGIQLGYYHSKFKGSELILSNTGNTGNEEGGEGEDKNDENKAESSFDTDLPTHDVSGGAFDFSLGVRYEHPKFHLGLSALHLTSSKVKLSKDGENATDLQYIESKLPMTLYFEAGGNIAINNSLFTLQPSLLLGTEFSDFTGIAEMRATYNQKITFGVDYRYNRAVGVLAGLSLKNFYIGYNWEYDYKLHPRGSTGNHELVLGYQFKMDMGGKSNFSQRSIRIM